MQQRHPGQPHPSLRAARRLLHIPPLSAHPVLHSNGQARPASHSKLTDLAPAPHPLLTRVRTFVHPHPEFCLVKLLHYVKSS